MMIRSSGGCYHLESSLHILLNVVGGGGYSFCLCVHRQERRKRSSLLSVVLQVFAQGSSTEFSIYCVGFFFYLHILVTRMY